MLMAILVLIMFIYLRGINAWMYKSQIRRKEKKQIKISHTKNKNKQME